jgi:co-chaperonin GroES (HSP10)
MDKGGSILTSNIGRSMRSIHPLGFRVVVRLRKEEARTDSGLYLPEGAKQAQQESLLGEVIEVASALEMDSFGQEEEVNVSGIPEGALILMPRDAGIKVPWDEDLRIVDTKQILAIVSEEEIS